MDPELTSRQRQILKQMSEDPGNAQFGRRLEKIATRSEGRRIGREVAISLVLGLAAMVYLVAVLHASIVFGIVMAIMLVGVTQYGFVLWRRHCLEHRRNRLTWRYRRYLR